MAGNHRQCQWKMAWPKSPEATVYLGFPIFHNEDQLAGFLSKLLNKIEIHGTILSNRNLSILGKALVANTLFLSKIWHVLRVISPPRAWIKKCEQVVRKFVSLWIQTVVEHHLQTKMPRRRFSHQYSTAKSSSASCIHSRMYKRCTASFPTSNITFSV